jgi:hypothetical protein
MNEPARDLIHLVVDGWLDQFTELSDPKTMAVQLHCADFHNLKRKTGRFRFLTGTALIPLQIKYNIIQFL